MYSRSKTGLFWVCFGFFFFQFSNLFQSFWVHRKQYLWKEMLLANWLVFPPVNSGLSYSVKTVFLIFKRQVLPQSLCSWVLFSSTLPETLSIHFINVALSKSVSLWNSHWLFQFSSSLIEKHNVWLPQMLCKLRSDNVFQLLGILRDTDKTGYKCLVW